jgi:hypothetical protein
MMIMGAVVVFGDEPSAPDVLDDVVYVGEAGVVVFVLVHCVMAMSLLEV